jgi:hypothetical protein
LQHFGCLDEVLSGKRVCPDLVGVEDGDVEGSADSVQVRLLDGE